MLARERIDQLVAELTLRGWPAPILVEVGTAIHARYKIDLANDEGSLALIVAVLKAASAMFSDDRVKVDTSLSNAARIIKLPGTMSRKGDDIPARPHRLSEVISTPDQLRVVSVEMLEAFISQHHPTDRQPKADQWPGCDTSGTVTVAPTASLGRAYVFASGFPESIAGQNGHGRLYHVACVLVDKFGLNREQAMPIFQEWNRCKAQPPESDAQLAHKLDDAIKKHRLPSCKLLKTDRGSGLANFPNGDGRFAVEEDQGDDSPIVAPEWPEPPNSDAYYGLAGDIVNSIAPETEADPVALLVQLLVGFGNQIGRVAYASVGAAALHQRIRRAGRSDERGAGRERPGMRYSGFSQQRIPNGMARESWAGCPPARA